MGRIEDARSCFVTSSSSSRLFPGARKLEFSEVPQNNCPMFFLKTFKCPGMEVLELGPAKCFEIVVRCTIMNVSLFTIYYRELAAFPVTEPPGNNFKDGKSFFT